MQTVTSVLDWLRKHPEVFEILLGLLAMLLLFVAKQPRAKALRDLLFGFGWDIPKIVDAVRRLVTGAPPPGGDAGVGGNGDTQPPRKDPPSDMRTWTAGFGWALAAVFALVLLVSFAGCGGRQPTPSPRATGKAAVILIAGGAKGIAATCNAYLTRELHDVEQWPDEERADRAIAFGDRCTALLMPLRDGLRGAVAAFDNIPRDGEGHALQVIGCLGRAFLVSLEAANKLLAGLHVKLPPEVTEGAEFARQVSAWALPSCNPRAPSSETRVIEDPGNAPVEAEYPR